MTNPSDPEGATGACSKMAGCKRALLALFAGFVFIIVFDLLFHGLILGSAYRENGSAWRPQAEMENLIWWMTMCQFLTALVAVGLVYVVKCVKCSFMFPLTVGLLLGIHQLGTYTWLPVPMFIPIGWFIGATIEGFLLIKLVSLVMGGCCGKTACGPAGCCGSGGGAACCGADAGKTP